MIVLKKYSDGSDVFIRSKAITCMSTKSELRAGEPFRVTSVFMADGNFVNVKEKPKDILKKMKKDKDK